MIYGFDPGEHTGIAGLSIETGEVKEIIEVWGKIGLFKWLEELTLTNQEHEFVVENFRVRPSVPLPWNELIAVRIIGALEYYCFIRGFKITIQEASIKPIAYKKLGLEYKKGKKGQHMLDASAHAYYYWEKKYGKANAAKGSS